jgi:hypothetical protein
VILADRAGRVVARWSGDSALERRLEAESISLGFLLTEGHAGTNGIGTALFIRLVPGESTLRVTGCVTCASITAVTAVASRISDGPNGRYSPMRPVRRPGLPQLADTFLPAGGQESSPLLNTPVSIPRPGRQRDCAGAAAF